MRPPPRHAYSLHVCGWQRINTLDEACRPARQRLAMKPKGLCYFKLWWQAKRMQRRTGEWGHIVTVLILLMAHTANAPYCAQRTQHAPAV